MALGKRKKTKYPIQDVCRVLKQKGREDYRIMQQLRRPFEIDGVPYGYFYVANGRVYCPKKRGERVLVTYSSVFQEEV